jgi:Ca2+-transporting ATPase
LPGAEIVHDAVAGRVRLRHPGLRAAARVAQAVETRLRDQPGIASVRASALTGSVLIEYQPPMTAAWLARALDAALAGRPLRSKRQRRRMHALSAAAIAAGPLNPCHPWYTEPIDQVGERLGTRRCAGLSPEEVAQRLAIHGRNELRRAEPRSVAAILAEQLTSLPIALLGASAALSLATGGIADAAVIAAVVALNAGIATATERQAEGTILGLSDYAPQPVAVIRGGSRRLVDPSELVPGDLLLLERGTLVAADAHAALEIGRPIQPPIAVSEASRSPP